MPWGKGGEGEDTSCPCLVLGGGYPWSCSGLAPLTGLVLPACGQQKKCGLFLLAQLEIREISILCFCVVFTWVLLPVPLVTFWKIMMALLWEVRLVYCHSWFGVHHSVVLACLQGHLFFTVALFHVSRLIRCRFGLINLSLLFSVAVFIPNSLNY